MIIRVVNCTDDEQVYESEYSLVIILNDLLAQETFNADCPGIPYDWTDEQEETIRAIKSDWYKSFIPECVCLDVEYSLTLTGCKNLYEYRHLVYEFHKNVQRVDTYKKLHECKVVGSFVMKYPEHYTIKMGAVLTNYGRTLHSVHILEKENKSL